MNCAGAVREVMVRGEPPLLTREMTTGELFEFTVWGLKLKLEGEAPSWPLVGLDAFTVIDTCTLCVALAPTAVSVPV